MYFRDASALQNPFCLLKIFDEDMLSEPDAMGSVRIPIPTTNKQLDSTQWYSIPADSAKNASGKVQVRIETNVIFSRSLVRGNEFELDCHQIAPGWFWFGLGYACRRQRSRFGCLVCRHFPTRSSVDARYGLLCQHDCQFQPIRRAFGRDEQEGGEEGDDERILMHLDKIPPHVLAMYIVLTVATPNMRIPDIRSTTL
jgi:hypothetical protein